jgi:hypothetical protein
MYISMSIYIYNLLTTEILHKKYENSNLQQQQYRWLDFNLKLGKK